MIPNPEPSRQWNRYNYDGFGPGGGLLIPFLFLRNLLVIGNRRTEYGPNGPGEVPYIAGALAGTAAFG
jgi:hypothetical protein